MATTPLRISSVVVVISKRLSIESLLKSFNDASQFFDPPRGKVSLHQEHLKYLCRIPHFQHQWRTADHLATLCHKWFTIPEPLQFDGNNVNNVLRKDPALKLDILAEKSAPNQFVIYHDT
jgi:hypothetical protein